MVKLDIKLNAFLKDELKTLEMIIESDPSTYIESKESKKVLIFILVFKLLYHNQNY
jgi:hypothetical protein